MTHEEFNRLYDNNEITIKIWEGIVENEEKSIEAFEYNNKFYLRIHSVYKYVTGERAFGKKYRMTRENHFIKEFDDKNYANNYFKKISKGLHRVI